MIAKGLHGFKEILIQIHGREIHGESLMTKEEWLKNPKNLKYASGCPESKIHGDDTRGKYQ